MEQGFELMLFSATMSHNALVTLYNFRLPTSIRPVVADGLLQSVEDPQQPHEKGMKVIRDQWYINGQLLTEHKSPTYLKLIAYV